jgi:subtilase family serine protease
MARVSPKRSTAQPVIEELEPRDLPSIFTPADIRHAYGFDNVRFGSVAGNGAGQTIAIVEAFHDPRIIVDLREFDKAFNLHDPVFTQVEPEGATSVNADWAMETALDVEGAHAVAPGAKVLLVETRSDSISDLLGGVNYARRQRGVAVVSMSWGLSESAIDPSFEKTNDKIFTTPAGHTGVTFTAATGDDGGQFGPEWPASSPNVLSVGGTSLQLGSRGNYARETAWPSGGGGQSSLEREPTYQRNVQKTGRRTTPDVSLVADPNTGLYVYDTVPLDRQTGFFQVGGTSAGAPMWAGLIAIADQGRAREGKATASRSPLDGAADTLRALYALPRTDFHDVTAGANDAGAARPGYDLATGLGTPIADRVIAGLLKVSAVSRQA